MKSFEILNGQVFKLLAGKHPVSALVELCNKRRWGSPDFQLVHEGGPDHKKNFLFKVREKLSDVDRYYVPRSLKKHM